MAGRRPVRTFWRLVVTLLGVLAMVMMLAMAAFTLTGQERYLALTPQELFELEAEEWLERNGRRG